MSQMLFISVRLDFSPFHAFAWFAVPTSTSTRKTVTMHGRRKSAEEEADPNSMVRAAL